MTDIDRLKGDPAPPGAVLLRSFKVLHDNWEMDNEGWIYEHDGRRFIVLTNHGRRYRAEPQELLDKIAEYRSIMEATKAALDLVTEQEKKA